MKNKSKLFLAVLTFAMLAAVFTGCMHSSPKAVARSYILDYKTLNPQGLANIHYTENKEERQSLKTFYEELFEKAPTEEIAQNKSMRFKKYSQTERTGDNEKGEILVTYKKEGGGERLENTVGIEFIKVKKKWYVKSDSAEEESIDKQTKGVEMKKSADNFGVKFSGEDKPVTETQEKIGKRASAFFKKTGTRIKEIFTRK